MKRIYTLIAVLFILPLGLMAQVTTSSMSGVVNNQKNEALSGATVTAVHLPTGTSYSTSTKKSGNYNISNMNPGGPYKVTVTYVGYLASENTIASLDLGETYLQNFELGTTASNLEVVVVTSNRGIASQGKGGTETSIGRDKMENLPTVGRNIADYLRYVPQAKVTGDGGISLAGQNNRYNSFYIDGAVNNDVFGLAGSGTNGGQAGISPISIDAIDQFQVVLSPYDASLGNFTGGGINAITRSGTNELHGSAYYFFRNQDLSGKTPGVSKAAAVKLSDFTNKTYGFRLGGPIVKNKLFFFISGEVQRDLRPQPSGVTKTSYVGAAGLDSVRILKDFIKTTYGYETGGFEDNPETVEANRIATKFDYNINDKNKLSLSYRYNQGFRNNTSRSSNSTINFFNNGYEIPTITNSGSLELNSRFKASATNKLLLTFTNVNDDRGALGDPFPRVRINDGTASIFFGTEEFSTGNLLKQNNAAIFDVFKITKGKNTFSVGTDNEFSKSTNVFIRQNYGSYVFNSVNDFLTNKLAATYAASYSLLDPGKTGDESVNAAAKFNTLRLGFFAGDEIKVNKNFTVSAGVRLDNTKFLTTPREDKFFNDTAIAKISAVYDLKGARSGQISDPAWSLNPRLGFVYKVPKEGVTIRGGVGTFTGRVPLVWPGGVYNLNGVSIGGVQRSNVAFRPDPFAQYTAADFGITQASPSGEVNLISENFKLNKVFRTSIGLDKQLGNKWKVTVEGIFTKNINEIDYKRVDIEAPTLKTVGVDVRDVYALTGNNAKQIALRGTTSPYTGVYLLSNSDGKKGYSYSATFSVDKAFNNNWAFNANYTYGGSTVRNEGTSSQNLSQWRFMETVNGRNNLGLSTSDFDIKSRINAYVSKKFEYANKHLASSISLVYNGASGNPYSYIVNRGFIRDFDNFETNDLLFVPTTAQIQTMTFLTNTVAGVTYTPQQQRDAYDQYLNQDKYLSKRRGQYAERNGARLPFTNILDLKLQQDFSVKFGDKRYALQLTYDVFNLTNLISRSSGRQFFTANDQINLLDFTGFVSTTNLTPQYRFNPNTTTTRQLLNISDGVFNSSRWSSQLGVRLSF